MATVTEVLEDFQTYSDYDEVGSVSRAKSFRTAARKLLGFPSEASRNGNKLVYDREWVAEQLRSVDSWLAENDTTSTDTSNFNILTVDSDFRR